MKKKSDPKIVKSLITHVDRFGVTEKLLDLFDSETEQLLLDKKIYTQKKLNQRNDLLKELYKLDFETSTQISKWILEEFKKKTKKFRLLEGELKALQEEILNIIRELHQKGQLELQLWRGDAWRKKKRKNTVNREFKKNLISQQRPQQSLEKLKNNVELQEGEKILNPQELTPRQQQAVSFLLYRAIEMTEEERKARDFWDAEFKMPQYVVVVFKSKELYETVQEKGCAELSGSDMMRIDENLESLVDVRYRLSMKKLGENDYRVYAPFLVRRVTFAEDEMARIKKKDGYSHASTYRILAIPTVLFGKEGKEYGFIPDSPVDYLTLKNTPPKYKRLTESLNKLFLMIRIEMSHNNPLIVLKQEALMAKIGMSIIKKNKARSVKQLEEYLTKLVNHKDLTKWEKDGDPGNSTYRLHVLR